MQMVKDFSLFIIHFEELITGFARHASKLRAIRKT